MDKIVKNYLYNLSYQILILIVPLITTPYVSRTLGAKGIGTFSYTNSIVQYFILFGCIGLNLYGQREIAYVQHEQKKKYSILGIGYIKDNHRFYLPFYLFFHLSCSWNICVYFSYYEP